MMPTDPGNAGGAEGGAASGSRRRLLRGVAAAGAGLAAAGALGAAPAASCGEPAEPPKRPNLVFVFADQWRAQAAGHAGDPNVKTPSLDRLAGRSVRFTNAVSCCPVCSPYRASLLTGQYADTHGVFLNDVHLASDAPTIAKEFKRAGYDTAYVGKWHLNDHGRLRFIPRADRQGFDFWRVMECTHNYNKSPYYADEDKKLFWEGYDARAQTACVQEYLRGRDKARPFALFLSWGPPHDPYETAPPEFRAMYDPAALKLRANVPKGSEARARKWLAGYYAHCSALDRCLGELLATLQETGLEDNTVFVFTSDHGDMLGSHGEDHKQRPYDESILVPFLLRWPAGLGQPREIRAPLNSPDIMPTLLGLCGLQAPKSAQGADWSPVLLGRREPPADGAALIACYAPFGEWTRARGGREYRGVRTERYTYVRDLKGPWLLFDNQQDCFQMKNLAGSPEHAEIQKRLEEALQRELRRAGDEFLPGGEYLRKWGYKVDATGSMPTRP